MNIQIFGYIYMNISEEKYEEIARDGIRYRVAAIWNSLSRLFFIILLLYLIS